MAEERMDPVASCSASFWEHAYRYRFAAHYIPEKRVLDIACGEGYGTAALERAGSQSVVGIDLSQSSVPRPGGSTGGGFARAMPMRFPLPTDRST